MQAVKEPRIPKNCLPKVVKWGGGRQREEVKMLEQKSLSQISELNICLRRGG